jgi:Mg-chelatase subunit ChlD
VRLFSIADDTVAIWSQLQAEALEENQEGQDPLVVVASRAMLAMQRMFHARENTRGTWHESYEHCYDELKRTE